MCIFNDPKEGFSNYLISLWRIFWQKEAWHRLSNVLIGLNKQLCWSMGRCVSISTRCSVLGGLFVSIWFPMCAYRLRNMLTFVECASSLMKYVSRQFTVRHSQDTHVVLPSAMSCVISKCITQENCHQVGVSLLNHSLKSIKNEPI